ncbi:MAG: alpha/beta fold hydrolase [Pseudomonadota bacterium]
MPFDKPIDGPPTARLPGEVKSGAPFSDLDHQLRGRFAALFGGQSPWAALQAWEDWAFHLSVAPGRQLELWRGASAAALSLWGQARSGQERSDWAFQPEPSDRRFRSAGWQAWPYNLLAQVQLAAEHQWRAATSPAPGVDPHLVKRVEFLGRFALNALAPVNFAATNPEVVEAARTTGGTNFAAGAALLADDIARLARGETLKGMDAFKVGQTMALTEGEVIFRNELMELIRYTPTTRQVRREPILITPAWIMKYYILDLTPPDSLVGYLVDQGFTVFIISWKNPGPEMRDTSFEDYRRNGVMTAIDVVGMLVPDEKIHAVGYCLGGTVLAIAAAAMDRDNDDRLASLTLLAAQTDFEDAGELMMFIDESQLALLEDMMSVRGYLDARQMAGAFYALRANEMLFAKLVDRYLLGKIVAPAALDAWLADPTRMPAKMHSEYLRQLFLDNSFAHGSYQVGGRAVALKDIRTPIFALGAERDHIAPWRSVYKIELFASAETAFVLAGGGHNTSVVSPPGKPRAYYRQSVSEACGDYVDPDLWLEMTPKQEGSWWPAWVTWLDEHSSGERVDPPPMGPPDAIGSLGSAPGLYVFEV